MADHALYLEVDEDITSAIDKLRKAPGASVQIVVPKRSGILQSIINLKLLKKAAADAGKELVLVTNDKVAGDLAGRIGIPVAAAIGSRPVINMPARPEPKNYADEVIEADDPVPATDLMDLGDGPVKAEGVATKRPAFSRRDIDKPRPVGAVAAAAAIVAAEAEPAEVSVSEKPMAAGASKVPSFTKLQRRLAWVGLAALVIIGYLVGMYYLSSANVKLFAVGTKVSVDGAFIADTAAKVVDNEKGILPAQTVTFSKDASVAVVPTGQKDNGTKASGTMTISNCYDQSEHPFVAGTRFQAPDGKIFRSTTDVVVPAGQGSFVGCTKAGTANVNVQADQNGDSYNEAPTTYSIPALPANQQSGPNSISAKGAQMSGGTSKIATIVTQADVDKAINDTLAKDADSSNTALAAKLAKNAKPLPDTLGHTNENVVPSPAVGQEASAATVAFKVTYTELSVDGKMYSDFIRTLEQKQIGPKNQIYDDGTGAAQLTSTGKDPSGRAAFHFSVVAYGGVKLDTAAIATQLKGKKYGDATTFAGGQPGVDHVEINVWPAWSNSLPKRPSRIHVTVSVASNKG